MVTISARVSFSTFFSRSSKSPRVLRAATSAPWRVSPARLPTLHDYANLRKIMYRRNVLYSAIASVAAGHLVGRFLDLSHISWRTCVADQLADHTYARPMCATPCARPTDSWGL
jgi:hypothetical protein